MGGWYGGGVVGWGRDGEEEAAAVPVQGVAEAEVALGEGLVDKFNIRRALEKQLRYFLVRNSIKAAIDIIGIIVIVLAIFYGMYFAGFNAVQAKDESVKKLAADVDAQLQRRYDLIPNLVASVKG